MLPIIGITSYDEHKPRSTYQTLNINYTYSVSAAGGLALTLPGASALSGFNSADTTSIDDNARTYIQGLDALILSGGGDVSATMYGEQPSRAMSRMDSDRDRWELALFSAAMEKDMPVLGICRGCQVINVAMGGTLHQDIASEIPSASGHSFDVPMDEPAHHIDIIPGTRLEPMFTLARPLVNSFHHQAIKKIASGLLVSARSPDGIIEAVESDDPDRFIVAVQFHPEGMTRRFPAFLGLFRALVKAAGDYRVIRLS
ncbi:MAG: gamma-glutamyl-gamma-aminobutyrate hydrolase family protein [Spirochaetia bacterium]|nr:gamma-glutamyl-gamma-aminobutyrate hydrolase family protein [Spirochaetia bacterium]